jgi:hypothetical protein
MRRGWGSRAVLLGLIFFCAGKANAEEPETVWTTRAVGSTVLVFGGATQQVVNIDVIGPISTKLAGQKYADGPSLGRSEMIGEDSLLGGLVADENYIPQPVPKNLRKIKRSQRALQGK